MSDNKLLTENTVRRFMKLANVDGLTDTFIESSYGKRIPKGKSADTEEPTNEVNSEEEADITEQAEEEEDVAGELADEEPADDLDMGDMPEDPEVGDDMEPGAADISLTEEEAQLLIDLGERLKEAMGDDADVDPAGDMDLGAGEDGLDLDADPDLDDAPEEEEDMMQETIVNEVLKRVTKRIVSERIKRRA